MSAQTGRIDVHHHLLPPFYRRLLAARGIQPGGIEAPEWTAQKSLRLMARNGIGSAVLSLSTPGSFLGDPAEARSLARRVNEFSAGVVREHPRHFGFFATLTLPDVAAAIEEADYALDQLGADGIVLLTNVSDHYIYEPAYEPLLAHLHDRRAVVFLHPGELRAAPAPGIPSFTADFLLDTVRAATGLLLSGSLERYTDIGWILSHAGGFLPYISHRVLLTAFRQEPKLAQARAILDRKREVKRRLDPLRRLYFDVALSSTPTALPSLLSFADPSRVLYGSDYPFAPAVAVRFMRQEYQDTALTRQQRTAIDYDNAKPLFPRLAA